MGALFGVVALILQIHVAMAASGSWQVGLVPHNPLRYTCTCVAIFTEIKNAAASVVSNVAYLQLMN